MSPPQPRVLPTMFPVELSLPFTLEEGKELNRLVRQVLLIFDLEIIQSSPELSIHWFHLANCHN
jgi:hypothetical protein